MGAKYNIEDLNKEYVGRAFNWLTVMSVFRSNSILYFKCRCKCGVVKDMPKKYVVSGKFKSCGCYRLSTEKAHKYSQWCKNNPDKVKERNNKCRQWCKDNPDKVKERGAKYAQWCKDNPDKKLQSTHNKEMTYLSRRAKIDYSTIIDYVHPDDVDDLLMGKFTAKSFIRTKCPLCGNFDSHKLHNVFTFSTCKLKYRSNASGKPPICSKCQSSRSSSVAEHELADFISSFYKGECIRNSRNIIAPLELDLYYPEKKIAIEFNGDYWHDEDHKHKDYHYNKFKLCLENKILLVSVFELEWITNKSNIKSYLLDLFSGKENKLSFKDNNTLNNNYPSLTACQDGVHIDDYYTHNNRKVFTCGYTKLD